MPCRFQVTEVPLVIPRRGRDKWILKKRNSFTTQHFQIAFGSPWNELVFGKTLCPSLGSYPQKTLKAKPKTPKTKKQAKCKSRASTSKMQKTPQKNAEDIWLEEQEISLESEGICSECRSASAPRLESKSNGVPPTTLSSQCDCLQQPNPSGTHQIVPLNIMRLSELIQSFHLQDVKEKNLCVVCAIKQTLLDHTADEDYTICDSCLNKIKVDRLF